MSERPSASKDRVPKALSEPDLLIPWSRGIGGTASLGVWRLRQAGDLAPLGYRLGIFGGEGKGTLPLTPFSPHLREVGAGGNDGLWLELE